MKLKSYRDLIAWKKSVALVTDVYRVTKRFPKDERWGLCSQLERAAVSVASNIAEGQGRNTTGEFVHFLGTAKGSLFELETQVIIGQNLGYVSSANAELLLGSAAEVGRIINGLMQSLESNAAVAITGH